METLKLKAANWDKTTQVGLEKKKKIGVGQIGREISGL